MRPRFLKKQTFSPWICVDEVCHQPSGPLRVPPISGARYGRMFGPVCSLFFCFFVTRYFSVNSCISVVGCLPELVALFLVSDRPGTGLPPGPGCTFRVGLLHRPVCTFFKKIGPRGVELEVLPQFVDAFPTDRNGSSSLLNELSFSLVVEYVSVGCIFVQQSWKYSCSRKSSE